MKTPEQLADEYTQAWWGPRDDNLTLATRQAFIAGYQAAKDQLFEETGFRLKLFKDEDDAKAAYQEALEEKDE